MADHTLASAADLPSQIDIEGAISDVAHLTALARWIEGARGIIDQLETCTRIDNGLASSLKEHDLRFGLDWQDEESAGLYLLLGYVRDSVAALRADSTASAGSTHHG